MVLRQKIGLGLLVMLGVGLAAGSWSLSRRPALGASAAVATYYGLYDPLRAIAGDALPVVNLTPAGAEPHDYEPTPSQLVVASRAKALVYNGGNLEPWTAKFLPEYHGVAIRGSRGLSLRAGDPHYWLDPVLMQQAVANIRDGLAAADPADAPAIKQRAAAYTTKLADLDQAFKAGLAQCQRRTIVSSHDAFGYLARRYRLEAISVAGISPDAEPSPEKLASLSRLVKDRGIKYIFFESLVSPKLADTLATETGAETLVFDPLEGLTQADQAAGKDYFSVQRQNLANLRQALDCS